MTKLDWERASLRSKVVHNGLSITDEIEYRNRDRAARWLAKVEERIAADAQKRVAIIAAKSEKRKVREAIIAARRRKRQNRKNRKNGGKVETAPWG